MEAAGNLMERMKWRRLLFFFILALSETDKMKLDWTQSNRGSCEGTALWLILCSFNKLSAKGPHLSSKQAAFTVFSSPLLHVVFSCSPCLRVQLHVENAGWMQGINCLAVFYTVWKMYVAIGFCEFPRCGIKSFYSKTEKHSIKSCFLSIAV